MAEELDDGEFWLPPKFLSDQDDDLLMDLTRPNSDVSESSDDDDYLFLSLAHSSLSHKNNKAISTTPPPVFVPADNPNRANQLKQQHQVTKQQQGNFRRGQQQMSPRYRGGNASNGRPLGLSPHAWPTLQQSRHPHHNSGTRAVFLQYPSTEGKCSGTGVFLPRPVGAPTRTLNEPECSTVLVPGNAFPQLQNKSKTSNAAISSSDHDAGGKNQNRVQAQHRWNVAAMEPQAAPISNEVQLPQEWTY